MIIFNLSKHLRFAKQFTSKQLEKLAKKAEKDAEKEQAKVKKVRGSVVHS